VASLMLQLTPCARHQAPMSMQMQTVPMPVQQKVRSMSKVCGIIQFYAVHLPVVPTAQHTCSSASDTWIAEC